MVEDNDNKKRKGLFGTRKTTRKVQPAPQVTPDTGPQDSAPLAPSVVDVEAIEADAVDQSVAFPALPTPFDESVEVVRRPTTSLLFQAPAILPAPVRTGGRVLDDEDDDAEETSTVRRRARRRTGDEGRGDDPANTVVRVRATREPELITEPQRIKGSTRLEAKKQRRRDGRDAGRRRPVITEAEFLARRESVDRAMVVRAKHNKIQIGVLEDGVLVEHYVAKNQDASLIGNVYLGRVQNVLPSMEAAFVDIGRGRNAVLYSGEVDWDAAAVNSPGGSQTRRIELALKPGDKVLVQVTKDPVGHKGARLTSQVSLPGRYLVYVPNGSMNGISRKLPDTERARLKKILKEVLPDNVGVIVRTAAEGATDEQLTLDVNRLTAQWASIAKQVDTVSGPALLHSEPDLLIKIVRDVFNEDFHKMVISGDDAQEVIESYLRQVAPDLVERVQRYEGERDAFDEYRISEQIEKALDRKVWLPSGGSLVIDRTEAMTVVDVNTGKFVGSGGNLEETVTKNNLEAADEIVRQLRLRDIGGIIVVDFIDMVLESNRDLVLRRLVECLSRDRTKHQVAEVTSLGLVQMTRKKLGLGLLESFSENCEACAGRGIVIHHDPVIKHRQTAQPAQERRPRSKSNGNGNDNGQSGSRNGGGGGNGHSAAAQTDAAKVGHGTHGITEDAKHALALIAARTITRSLTGSIPVVAPTEPPVADVATAAHGTEADPAHPGPAEAEAASATSGRTESDDSGSPSTATTSTGRSNPRGNRGRSGNRSGRPPANDAPTDAPTRAADEAAAADATAADATAGEGTTAPAADEAPRVPEAAVHAQASEPAAVEILDIPLTMSARNRRPVSKQVTDQLLDSVLDSLPEPKQPGQGRSRSRRVSTAGGPAATVQPIVSPAEDAG
ncbi:Rne/Rng family ribonuclease [Cryobacterium sp. 1639]|uniref:Rne/Rng family ribonuclease n=1 Tax=Cryobacterium inferilacus TaxID=2866629 RepID=UPI001C7387FC|nr:Rne/Rng family ribonuclease [Cryobacterium sp. 1639]MBX0298548.1 Rne/Rng family ribonuclease [Cryobacterium sp. 1639]